MSTTFLFYFLSFNYLVTSCYLEGTSSILYFLELWIMCFSFQICFCPSPPSPLLFILLSSHPSVLSHSLSFTLWRRVTNSIGGHSISSSTNSRNPSLEDMMPAFLNSSVFHLPSTGINLLKGHNFIWMLWVRSNSGLFTTYMVWLLFEFAFVNYSNTLWLAFLLEDDLVCWEPTKSPAVPDAELQNQPSPTACLQHVYLRAFAVLCRALPVYVWFST